MSILKKSRRALRRHQIRDPHSLWSDVIAKAVMTNQYEFDIELRVLLYLKVRRFDLLLALADSMSKQKYSTPMVHYRMNQLSALIRKYPFTKTEIPSIDPTGAARRTFDKAERRCRWVNKLFRAQRISGFEKHASFKFHMRGWISYVLGKIPSPEQIADECDFGGGANIGVHGNATNLARKLMSEVWSVYPDSVPLATYGLFRNVQFREAIRPSFASSGVKASCYNPRAFVAHVKRMSAVVRHNKISYVPKTAATDRSIAVEPMLSSFVQKGIDEILRRRLRRVGLDLSDQATNCHLAYLGSLPGQEDPYCTIDLSSASDTMATEVVRDVLPGDWFDLLNNNRAKYYEQPGEPVRAYHKFVSMGNGFCFPLQTLIFASICHAAYAESSLDPDFRVYGDDIIVRRSVFPRVVAMLRHHGFQPNPRKTFSQGPFRESCGMDWHSGINVRPVFVTKRLDSLQSLFTLFNETLKREDYVREYFREIRDYLYEVVPPIIRFVSRVRPSDQYSQLESTPVWEIADYEPPSDHYFWVEQDPFMMSPLTRWHKDQQCYTSLVLRVSAQADRWSNGRASPFIKWAGLLRGSSSEQLFSMRYSSQVRVAWLT